MSQTKEELELNLGEGENRTPSTEVAKEHRMSGGSESDDLDDEPDETVGERIWGLSEMFPESVRNFTSNIVDFTHKSIRGLYRVTCTASWIFFTSSMILFAPVVFETERAHLNEISRVQQKQVLLGPTSANAAINDLYGPKPI